MHFSMVRTFFFFMRGSFLLVLRTREAKRWPPLLLWGRLWYVRRPFISAIDVAWFCRTSPFLQEEERMPHRIHKGHIAFGLNFDLVSPLCTVKAWPYVIQRKQHRWEWMRGACVGCRVSVAWRKSPCNIASLLSSIIIPGHYMRAHGSDIVFVICR